MDRRDVIKAMGIGALGVAGGAGCASSLSAPSLAQMSMVEVAAAIRSGSISAESYAQYVIRQNEANNHLNAMIAFDGAYLLEQARRADARRSRGLELGPLRELAANPGVVVAGQPL